MDKKSVKSVVTGILFQVTNTVLGLILPYLFITNFGSETNGLLSSVAQIFVYLDLLEAGVGTASLQSLYKPFSSGDKDSISRIAAATNLYYKRIGCIYAALVVLISFVFPFFVDSAIPFKTIVYVILLQGCGAVWSFMFQAKYTILLKADGRVYVINTVMFISTIVRNIGKIVAIYLGYDVVAVQLINLIVIIIQSLIIIGYVKKKYEWLNIKAEPDTDSISQKNSVLLQQIAWLVFNHTDVFLLTIVSRNLALVSVYAMYTLVFEAVQNVIETSKNSFQYKLGWLSQQSSEKFNVYFKRYKNYYFAVSFALFLIAYALITPFMRLYTAKATDINYLVVGLPLLFLIMKVLYSLRGLGKQVIEAVGDFKKTEFIAVGEVIINIGVSLILVFRFGIIGVLLGTITALVYSDICYFVYCSKNVLKSIDRQEIIDFIIYSALLVGSVFVVNSIGDSVNSYAELLLRAIITGVIVFAEFILTAIVIDKKLHDWSIKNG